MNPEGEQQKKGFWQNVIEWVITIAIALLIALPIRYFLAEPFIVSGASMDPTFASGQFLIVDRLSYRLGDPERGDVVVFEYPNDPSTYYIKRVIGLPGESVRMADGKIYISSLHSTSTVGANSTSTAIREDYIDINHVSHDTFSIDLDDTHYFVLGDNRIQSSDSRAWGPLDRELIIGRPFIRLLPLKSISIFPGKPEKTDNR